MNKSKRDSNGLNKRERAILKFIQSNICSYVLGRLHFYYNILQNNNVPVFVV